MERKRIHRTQQLPFHSRERTQTATHVHAGLQMNDGKRGKRKKADTLNGCFV